MHKQYVYEYTYFAIKSFWLAKQKKSFILFKINTI